MCIYIFICYIYILKYSHEQSHHSDGPCRKKSNNKLNPKIHMHLSFCYFFFLRNKVFATCTYNKCAQCFLA